MVTKKLDNDDDDDTNSFIDFKEMFRKSCYTTETRMMLYLSDREWVNERNIIETFYTTGEPLTKKNMKSILVDLNTLYTNQFLTICLKENESVKIGSSVMSVKAIDKRYITAERAALNFYIYFQDSKIECSSENARALEKIAHVFFYHYRIVRATDAISQRSEFFKKFSFSVDDKLTNQRAAMLRIMVYVCNLSATQFMICKEALENVPITAAYGLYMHLLPDFMRNIGLYEAYPQNLLIKKAIKIKDSKDDIFFEEHLETLATSLFVEIKARIFPEQVFIVFRIV